MSVDGDGVVGVIAWVRDLTEQQDAQRALADVEARVAQYEVEARTGSWMWDRASGAVQWSGECHRLFGVDPREFDGTLLAHLGCIHADDRHRMAEAITAAVQNRSGYEEGFRVLCNAGRVLRTRVTPVVDAEGDVLGLRAVVWDAADRASA